MKKIVFSRTEKRGYDKDLKQQTELVPTNGYYFEHKNYQFVLHKYDKGWRVSEFTTGCGMTTIYRTRKETMQYFLLVFAQHEKKMRQTVTEHITKYGQAN